MIFAGGSTLQTEQPKKARQGARPKRRTNTQNGKQIRVVSTEKTKVMEITETTPVGALRVCDLLKILEDHRQPQTPLLEDIVDIHEASKLIGYTEKSIRTKTCRGDIPFIKVGGKLRFRRSELEKWILEG
ncbi:MAG: hypothetical protein A2Y71_03070 [Bacteroidetes bacterium RBG_13_42_15]|nr:MAG: hypothetical protein A2Y71_03070 [Bacteroidetes bacterium RBG_13_42_15]